MKLKIIRYCCLVALLIAFKTSYAQNSIDKNLDDYLLFAAKNNPTLLSKYNEYQASLQMVPQVGSLPDPEVSLGYFIKPKAEMMGNQVADIRLMQMFPWFGTLGASKNEASSMAKAKFEEFSEIRNRLFYDVKSKYYQLYRLHKEVELTKENLKILKTYEQISLVKFRTGSVSGNSSARSTTTMNSGNATTSLGSGMSGGMANSTASAPQPPMSANTPSMSSMPASKGMVDVLRVQMEIRELESQLAYLQDQEIPIQTEFNSLLNRDTNIPVILPDSLSLSSVEADFVSIRETVLSENPMLKMYAAEQESYQAKISKSKAMGYPMVGIGLDYMVLQPRVGNDAMDNGKDMLMPMLTVTLPIYRHKYSAMRREAEFQLKASQLKQQSARNDLTVALENAILDLKDAQRKISQYNAEIILSQQSINVLIAGYSSSGSDFEEVLRMQQKWLDFRFKIVETGVRRMIAEANIEYLMAKKIVEAQ